MTENMFESMEERLRESIAKEIAYTYVAFAPNDTKVTLSKMKKNIRAGDRMFLSKDLQNSVGKDLIVSYDVLNTSLEKYIDDFYNEITLGREASEKLSVYGDRGERFKKKFNDSLKQSKNSFVKDIKNEMTLQMMQSKDAKSVVAHMQNVLTKRLSSLKKFLGAYAGQMGQYMVLWDYQDKGYTHYRLKTNGDNCEECTKLNGKIFPIDKAESGKTIMPFHPNCDCSAEIVDENERTVFVIEKVDKKEKSTDALDYLQASFKQVILGNYADDSNLLGTLGQIALGLLGIDLPADIRDIVYDITEFEMSPQHALQTLFDALALLPVVGGIKYIDEAGDTLKATVKHGDEAVKELKNNKKIKPMTAKEALEAARALGFEPTGQFSHGQPVFKKANKYITPDIDSHIGGVWKMADSIKGLRNKKTRIGTYDDKLRRIGD